MKGLVIFEVIIAQKMQESVDDKMGKMIGKFDPQIRRFALNGLAREGDVANQPGKRRKRLDLRETEDVGGLVDLPPVAVEDALGSVVGKDERHFADPAHLGAGLLQGLENSGFSDGIEAVGPVFGFDDCSDFERGPAGGQLALSSLAVAPS